MNTKQAIVELKQFLKFKQAAIHAEQLLENLAFAEQEKEDAEKARDKLKAEVSNLGSVKEKALADADSIRAKAQAELDAVNGKADKIIEAAEKEAESYSVQIKESEKILEDLAGKIAGQKATLRELDKTIADKQAKLAEIEAERKKAIERLGA